MYTCCICNVAYAMLIVCVCVCVCVCVSNDPRIDAQASACVGGVGDSHEHFHSPYPRMHGMNSRLELCLRAERKIAIVVISTKKSHMLIACMCII